MTTAYKAETKLNECRDVGCGWTKGVAHTFEWLLNEYISEVKSVDLFHRVIDFKDGSVIVFKEDCLGSYYVQSQYSRG